MKKAPKLLAIAALLVAFYNTGFAQFSVGLRGGFNFSNVYTTNGLDAITPDFQHISGPSIAGVLEYGISDHFALQTELAITRKGFKLGLDKDITLFNIPIPVGATAESRFNYVEVPLLAKAADLSPERTPSLNLKFRIPTLISMPLTMSAWK